jgi:hypothetical protein
LITRERDGASLAINATTQTTLVGTHCVIVRPSIQKLQIAYYGNFCWDLMGYIVTGSNIALYDRRDIFHDRRISFLGHPGLRDFGKKEEMFVLSKFTALLASLNKLALSGCVNKYVLLRG